MITPEQREYRKKYIGSSDTSAILGLNPWRTPADVWLEKTGRLNERPATDPMSVGNYLESALVRWLSDELRAKFVESPSTIIRGVMCANLDGVNTELGAIAECKYTSMAGDWGDAGTGDVPAYVATQCQHQAEVMGEGFNTIYVPVAMVEFHSLVFKKFIVPADRAVGQMLGEQATDFFEQYIRTDTRPDGYMPSPSAIKLIRRTPKKVVVMDQMAGAILDDFEKVKAERLAAEKREELLKYQLVGMLGDAEAGNMPDGRTITYMETRRKGYTVADCVYRSLKTKGKAT